jgi:hypothetical protein
VNASAAGDVREEVGRDALLAGREKWTTTRWKRALLLAR